MKPILEIRNLGKKYRIQPVAAGSQNQPYLSLREALFSFAKSSRKKEEFWALQDLTFDVMPGETIGIIGRNGAGKSTLLKILSKITPPTKGSIISRGRIASLLEVGTGFHPELTGRENIYLNGSILGMKRAEINRQFDAILDFAGVEKFIETPLKHYSSGMQLRLAFAVAAFLEPEVLIVDEVLAVGDSEFQKKCMGKMKDVSEQGRTVLLVSHDLTAINNLTKKALYLKGGLMQGFALTGRIIEQYIREGQQKDLEFSKPVQENSSRPQVTSVKIKTSLPNNIHEHGRALDVEIEIIAPKVPSTSAWLTLHVTDNKNRGIVHTTSGGSSLPLITREGANKVNVVFPALKLYMGNYHLSVYMSGPPNGEVYERLVEILGFEVVMNGNNHEFGWIPDICTHIEDTQWSVAN